MKKICYSTLASLILLINSCGEKSQPQKRPELILEKTYAHKVSTLKEHLMKLGEKKEREDPRDSLRTISTYNHSMNSLLGVYAFKVIDRVGELPDELTTVYKPYDDQITYLFGDIRIDGGLTSAYVLGKETTKDSLVVLDELNDANKESFQELYREQVNTLHDLIHPKEKQ